MTLTVARTGAPICILHPDIHFHGFGRDIPKIGANPWKRLERLNGLQAQIVSAENGKLFLKFSKVTFSFDFELFSFLFDQLYESSHPAATSATEYFICKVFVPPLYPPLPPHILSVWSRGNTLGPRFGNRIHPQTSRKSVDLTKSESKKDKPGKHLASGIFFNCEAFDF